MVEHHDSPLARAALCMAAAVSGGRVAGDTHRRALRALANHFVGTLHGCLRHDTLYDEHTAWDTAQPSLLDNYEPWDVEEALLPTRSAPVLVPHGGLFVYEDVESVRVP